MYYIYFVIELYLSFILPATQFYKVSVDRIFPDSGTVLHLLFLGDVSMYWRQEVETGSSYQT